MPKAKQDARAIFDRSVAVCSNLLERVENHMKVPRNRKTIDPEAMKYAKELGALVNQLTKTQEQMNAKGMAHVGTMGLAEQFDVCLRFVCSLPIGYRQKALEAVQATLPKTKKTRKAAPKKKAPKKGEA